MPATEISLREKRTRSLPAVIAAELRDMAGLVKTRLDVEAVAKVHLIDALSLLFDTATGAVPSAR